MRLPNKMNLRSRQAVAVEPELDPQILQVICKSTWEKMDSRDLSLALNSPSFGARLDYGVKRGLHTRGLAF